MPGSLKVKKTGGRGVLGLALPLALLLFATPAAAQSTGDADVLLDGLQKRYDDTPDFTADFTQETEVKTLHRSITAAGKVYFKKPGKMLWKYDDPEGQVVLADGAFLYFYQPEQQQVLNTRLGRAFLTDTPLSFLLGIGRLKKDFRGTVASSRDGATVLDLTSRDGREDLGKLSLGVDGKNLDIRWARIEDAVGNVTTVRFQGMERNVGLKDSLFRLQIPKEVDVLELGSP